MLRIAVVGNNYQETLRFTQYKFKDKIAQFKASTAEFTLINGDIIILAYDERNKDAFLSLEIDAFVVVPNYFTLLDTIKHRCERARCY